MLPKLVLTSNPHNLEDFRLHQCFEFKINQLARHMQDRLEVGLAAHGITRVQWIALTAIAIEAKCSPSELAEHIGVSRPAVSRMLRLMESEDLIERSLIGDDGRTRQLSLTEKGKQCMIQCWPHVRETEQYFLDKVTEAQRESLSSTLYALTLGETEALNKI